LAVVSPSKEGRMLCCWNASLKSDCPCWEQIVLGQLIHQHLLSMLGKIGRLSRPRTTLQTTIRQQHKSRPTTDILDQPAQRLGNKGPTGGRAKCSRLTPDFCSPKPMMVQIVVDPRPTFAPSKNRRASCPSSRSKNRRAFRPSGGSNLFTPPRPSFLLRTY
jgi:hypothetical protein